jgi:hypothetical protein
MNNTINVFNLNLDYKIISINSTRILKHNKSSTLYNCICSCGKDFIISHQSILRNRNPCNCKKYINIANKRFHKLTVIKRINNKWLCKCDCGNEKLISYTNLKNGTKSCGCYNKERIKTIPQNFNSRKYSPEIASARRAWKNKYSDGNLTFDQFYLLSKQNCKYCNQAPSQIFNSFDKRYSKESKENGNFIYNGLDKINPNLPHNFDNLNTCCYTCNRFKSNSSLEDFKQRIFNIEEKEFKQHTINNLNLNKYQISNLKKIWSDSYNKEIPFDFFISISQCNCFYCGVKPSNYAHYQNNKKYSEIANNSGMIFYSGLDRFNNLPKHEVYDVVPCCKYCNFAKSNMKVQDFYSHINKIKRHLENK